MTCIDIEYEIKKDGKYWFIECKGYPVFTQGRTKDEAEANLREAFLLYAEDKDVQLSHPELKELFGKEKTIAAQVTSIAVTIPQSANFLEPVHDSFADPFRKRTGENPV